ncbi:hypothetical protein [Streptomyces sp. NBC_00503]|uniref:hypothetical protein n=1 Tax=Streptomyces sp. NBC_00503 TaxID=2903659 RepID=UPI002E822C35|nr:hypothetical protein [Streptomyces sp. NBC_00503]WUD82564.1 hypothetical protein OG490_19570 [Streptomyces sp. NBC_00503]
MGPITEAVGDRARCRRSVRCGARNAGNLADTDGNDKTVADPDWRPLSQDVNGNSFSPAFPSYVSGHSGIVGAWAGAMQSFYGRDDIAFTGGVRRHQSAHGSARGYDRMAAAGPCVADRRGPDEAHFIAERDSVYLASVSETGWPYIQHRGGLKGFPRVLGPAAVAFADYRGNKQSGTTRPALGWSERLPRVRNIAFPT